MKEEEDLEMGRKLTTKERGRGTDTFSLFSFVSFPLSLFRSFIPLLCWVWWCLLFHLYRWLWGRFLWPSHMFGGSRLLLCYFNQYQHLAF